MAGKNLMTTLVLTINNSQAEKMLEDMQHSLERTKKELAELQEKMNDPSSWGTEDTAKGLVEEEKRLKRTIKSYESAIAQGIKSRKGIDDLLQNLSGADYNELTAARTSLTAAVKNLDQSSEKYQEMLDKLQQVRDEIAKRDIDVRGGMTTGKAAEVMASPKDYSTTEINQAIEATRKLRDMQQTGSTEWHNYNTQIEAAKKFLDDFNASVRQASMEKQFVQLPTISDQALKEQKSYWQSMVIGAQQGSKELAEYEAKLKAVSAEEEERLSRKAGKVMGNLQDYSVEEIEEAIKLTEKLQKAQQPGSAEWQIYGEEIKKAKEYLQGYIDLDKQIDMEDKWGRLPQLSANALAEQKKYWQEMVNGAANGSKELDEYQAKLKEVVEEEQMRLDNRYTKVMQNPESYSVKEVQDAVKAYEQLRDAQRTGSGNWEYYNQVIERTRATLKKYNDEAKATAMSTKLSSISTASTASLAEQKKYWQEMVNGAEQGTQALKDYQENLDKVLAEEKTRIQQQGKQTVTDINTGNWDKTIGETKEAIKQLQEYRNTLNATNDATALQELDKALDTLTQKTKEAEQGFVSWQGALNEANNLDNFSGTIEQLEKMKKVLQEARKNKIDIGDTDQLEQIDKALANIDSKLDEVENGALDVEKVLKRPSAASYEELERVAKRLEKEIKRCAENTNEFAAKSEDLRRVNKQLDSIKKSFQEQENIILKTAKRLASYVLVYAGFNEIVGWVKQGINANLELSDSMADVQKTTGLAGIELQELGKSLEDMDTRTATTELYQLAAAAGQIGLKSQDDILGFANAANIISVALNELGAEGSASLMKIAQLTGELRDNSTEDALLRIGSAINELTANSAATAGPITDFINRFGGIAAAARITTHEMAALGAATDASAQSAEVAGTSMNKFVNALLANTQSVAYAADISYKELQGLIDSGKTMDAIVLVLERMRGMSAGAQQGLLKELGSEGARMNQYVSTLVANLDMLKEQLDISRTAYEENISVQNEYNVKNESAIGILQRMKNQIIDTFVNSRMTEILKDILVFISEIPAWFDRNRVALAALNSTIALFLTMKIPATLATIGTAMKQLITLLTGQFVQAWKKAAYDLQVRMIYAEMSVAQATARTTGFTGALRVLGHVIKTHPIMFIASIIATVATAIWTLTDRTDKLKEATAELEKTHRREIEELAAMREVILGTNSSYEAQMRVLKDLNSVYEKYLGFEIRILDSYAKKAAALDLITAKLREQQTMEMYNKETETVNENFAEESRDSMDNIKEAFVSIPEVGRKRWAEVKDVIEDALHSGELVMSGNSSQDFKRSSQFIQKEVFEKLGIAQDKLNAKQRQALYDIVDDLQEYATLYRDKQEQLNQIDEERQGQIAVNTQNSLEGYKKVAEAQLKDMEATKQAHQLNLEEIRKNGEAKKESEEDINKKIEAANQRHMRDMLKQQEEYLKTLGQLRDAEQQGVETKTLSIIETESTDSLRKEVEGVRKALDDDAIEAVENYRNTTAQIAQIQQELAGGQLKTEQEVHDKTVELRKLQIKQTEEMQTAQRKVLNFMVRDYATAYTKMEDIVKDAQKTLQGDPYGKQWNMEDWKTFGAGTIKNLGTASIESLTATYKALETESQTITQDISWFNDTFKELLKKPIESQKEMDKLVYQWAGQVKKELESRNRGTTGNFIWKSVGGDDNRSAKKKAQEEYRAAMAALEAYFNERETLIQKKGLEEGKTQVQINQQLETLQTEKLKDEIELRKLLLDEYYKESTFDPSKYKGVISGTDYFKEKNMEYLNALRVQLEKWGVAMEDGMKKQLTDRMVKLAEQALKLREKINKILLEDNFTEQVAQQYLDSLQELGLMFGLTEGEIAKSNKENGEDRLAYMKEWSKESYTMTVDDLKAKVEANELFSAWRIGREEEDYEALLLMLRKYNDDSIEAIKKAADRRKKIIDAKWNVKDSETGKSQAEVHEEHITGEEADLKMYESAERLGLGSQRRVDDAQIAVYNAKIEASQAYIAQIHMEMDELKRKAEIELAMAEAELEMNRKLGIDTTQQEAAVTAAKQKLSAIEQQENLMVLEEQQKILEQKQNIADVELSIEERKMNRLKEYTDNIISFGEEMGEAAWGSTEERQEAGKALLRSTLQLTKDLIMAEVKRLIMKKALNQQEIVAEQTKETIITTTKGEQDIARLTSEGAVTTGKVALGQTQGAAKTIAELGWWGIPLIAVISAALSALMGMAMSALSKSKSEVAAATGASSGRLATGMLTYAEGNYPVLGNDGQVYNAKYEGANIKTGIYGGGAHFGIFSEKKPEAIIDGDTTQRLILNHPDIWQSIVTLSKYGRLNTGMRTFATGNINELARTVETVEAGTATDSSAQMMQMQATLDRNSQIMAQLTQVLAGGIKASINMYGDDGLYKQSKKAEKFANRRGYK